jgi:hypothetical protein
MDIFDGVSKIIVSWGHRLWVEIGSAVFFFLLIHFGIYPFMQSRANHDDKPNTPSIKVGPVTTYGPNSPVIIGGSGGNSDTNELNRHASQKDKK